MFWQKSTAVEAAWTRLLDLSALWRQRQRPAAAVKFPSAVGEADALSVRLRALFKNKDPAVKEQLLELFLGSLEAGLWARAISISNELQERDPESHSAKTQRRDRKSLCSSRPFGVEIHSSPTRPR